MSKKIAVLVGSLRKDSYNRKVAKEMMRLAPESLQMEMVEIGHLPFYNEDLEEDAPSEWKEFREQIKSMDGLLFLSPEYNRTMSGVMKNALDVGSRPWGKSAWDGKPAGVVTVSPSALGGFGANHNIRAAAVTLNMPVMAQPEAYIGSAHELFEEDGQTLVDDTAQFISTFLCAFEKWVNRF